MKILIACYSLSKNTEKVAEAIKRQFEQKGHFVDMEKIRAVESRSFWEWFFIRFFKGRCAIEPPKIKDVSSYDAVCFGSPNWTRVSLPMKEYLSQIKGLEYKNTGFFSTTFLPALIEWFVFSAYLFDLTFTQAIEAKHGRVIGNIMLSSFFRSQGMESEYGKKCIEDFCEKITTPIVKLKDYLLNTEEIEEIRTAEMFLFCLFFLWPVLRLVFGIFTPREFLLLFLLNTAGSLFILALLARRARISFGKYAFCFLLAAIWMVASIAIGFSADSIILGNLLILISAILFKNTKVVFAAGAFIVLLFALYSFFPAASFEKTVGGFLFLALATGVIGFVAKRMEDYSLKLMAAQSEIESARLELESKIKERTRELEELTENLDLQVKEKTKDLQATVDELQRFQKLTVGRELKMVELKEEIETLKKNCPGPRGKIN